MKYLLSIIPTPFGDESNISTTSDDVNFVTFPAVVGNPAYDQFLVQVDLTDEEVKALPTNEWFEV